MNNLLAKDLPPRQAQILLLCAKGYSAKESAEILNCSPTTIRQTKTTLFYKLDANSTPELVTNAFETQRLSFYYPNRSTAIN